MILLITGVLLWTLVHLSPAIAPSFRAGLIERVGAKPYRGLFAAMIGLALVLIVLGWRSTTEEYLYVLPAWSRQVGILLMFLSFVLIGAANSQSIVKRYIRHPMLTGIFVWALSHLLTNGTTRALVLFGILGAWSLIEMPLINARDGARSLPQAPGFSAELKLLFISTIVFFVAIFLHPYFAGVSPLSK